MSATPTRRWAVEPPADSRLTQRRQSPTQIHRTRRTRTRRRKLRTPSHPTRPRHTPPDGRPVARIPTHRNRAMGYRKDRQMSEPQQGLPEYLDHLKWELAYWEWLAKYGRRSRIWRSGWDHWGLKFNAG